MIDILRGQEGQIAVLAAVTGAVFTVLVQFASHRYDIWHSWKKYRIELADLVRHLDASISSMDIPPDSAPYILAGRVKLCKYSESVGSLANPYWISYRNDAPEIINISLYIRNSDIILGEIADRIGSMNAAETQIALEDAKKNLMILREKIVGELER